MIDSKNRSTAIWSIFLTLWASSFANAAVIADANADFPPNVANPNLTNPNGVWTYGYTATLGGAFIPYGEYFTDPAGYGWGTNLSFGVPAFGKLTAATVNLNAGDTWLHGGPGGEYAVLRFMPLVAGVYDISAPWKPGDIGDANLLLILNGNAGSPLASTPSTNTAGWLQVTNVSLTVNDTLDLVLGTLGSFSFDTTGANLVISSIPEPTVSALLVMAASCGLLGRRAKRRD